MMRAVRGGDLAAILAGAIGLAILGVAAVQWNFHPSPRTAWTLGLGAALVALSVTSALSLARGHRRTLALSLATLVLVAAVVAVNPPSDQNPIDWLAAALGVLALAFALAAWRSAHPAPPVP